CATCHISGWIFSGLSRLLCAVFRKQVALPVGSFNIEDIIPDEPSYTGYLHAHIYFTAAPACRVVSSAVNPDVTG
ncbi:hypothetical protein AB4144_64010, partial [Rhizobiaceae sp. 2RAB30]